LAEFITLAKVLVISGGLFIIAFVLHHVISKIFVKPQSIYDGTAPGVAKPINTYPF